MEEQRFSVYLDFVSDPTKTIRMSPHLPSLEIAANSEYARRPTATIAAGPPEGLETFMDKQILLNSFPTWRVEDDGMPRPLSKGGKT